MLMNDNSPTVEDEVSQDTYSDAVEKGHYDLYQGGLQGKHDNVRCYWEEQIRGIRLRPHLQSLLRRKRKEQRKIRVCDLGAGSGEALRMITDINTDDTDLHLSKQKVLKFEDIEFYMGSDLCEPMVEQGNLNFEQHEQVHFSVGDFSKGFPHKELDPFDLYSCSFGSYSHISRDEMRLLLAEMIDHAGDRAIIIGDWLGRHSLEWPCYWNQTGDEMLDYSMSWMPGNIGGDEEPEHFPMRYYLGSEIRALFRTAAAEAGYNLKELELYDCSIFTGRHVDTREYNEWIAPLRTRVNQLHESNLRTDLEKLFVEIVPVQGQNELNGYFSGLQFQWNSLVEYCVRRLEKRMHPAELKNWRQFPSSLQMALTTIDRVVDVAYWLRMGDPRANIIEPQLGYVLRGLEMEYQKGEGRAHSLVGVFEIRRKGA